VALEAVRGEKALAEIAQKHDLHPTQINECRKQFSPSWSPAPNAPDTRLAEKRLCRDMVVG